jgi:NADPH:quinone reductase-like Zn-dependent oxidoreductase
VSAPIEERGLAATETMTAVVRDRYGVDALEVRQIARPELTDDGVLVRVRAASLNRREWYSVATPFIGRFFFGLLRPKERVPGVDFAGTVEAVGRNVTHVRPGDDVFGGRVGALAEYVCVRNAVVRMPANLTFEEAAAVPIAGLTALQGLRDKGEVRPGQQVLVNGASGGVGTFAVQIAKALGAEVTAVCSTRNVDQARALGADRVVDYTREDFTRSDDRYDVLFDVAGSRTWSESIHVLKPEGILVAAGAPMSGLLGPLGHVARKRVAALRGSQRLVTFVARFNRPDMEVLRELIEAGKVRPVVERRYELSQIADALRYVGEGHCRAKVVVTV